MFECIINASLSICLAELVAENPLEVHIQVNVIFHFILSPFLFFIESERNLLGERCAAWKAHGGD
jgi:hypothetical protein